VSRAPESSWHPCQEREAQVSVDDLSAITAITPELARVMRPFTSIAEDLSCEEQLIVNGTLVSCWSWEHHPELYSGKHHTTGLNLQVVCDLTGRLRWISDPVEVTWRILHTDYRRPLSTFTDTISAVIGLQSTGPSE
jgi:hypothetical protein